MKKSRSITKRELNQQTARVLARVKAGQPLLVTERGVPRWRIEAVDVFADPVTRMLAEGKIRSPSLNPPAWPVPEASRYTVDDVERLYQESRGDR